MTRSVSLLHSSAWLFQQPSSDRLPSASSATSPKVTNFFSSRASKFPRTTLTGSCALHWPICMVWAGVLWLDWLGSSLPLLCPGRMVMTKRARWVREKFLKDKEEQHFLNSVFNERLRVGFSYFQPRILTTKASCRKWDDEEGDFSRHRTVTLHTTSPQGCWCRAVALSSWPSSYTTRETHQIEEW